MQFDFGVRMESSLRQGALEGSPVVNSARFELVQLPLDRQHRLHHSHLVPIRNVDGDGSIGPDLHDMAIAESQTSDRRFVRRRGEPTVLDGVKERLRVERGGILVCAGRRSTVGGCVVQVVRCESRQILRYPR